MTGQERDESCILPPWPVRCGCLHVKLASNCVKQSGERARAKSLSANDGQGRRDCAQRTVIADVLGPLSTLWFGAAA